ERLLDQHRNATLDGSHDRINMQMLVGTDDSGLVFRPFEQFDVALRHKICVDLRAHFSRAVRVFFGEPDPLDSRMARCHLATEQADAAAADDREPDTLGRGLHCFAPARIFGLNSAMAEIDSLESGRSTASFG